MTEVRFYHLMSKRLEQTLPEVLARAVDRGQRTIVKAGSRERLEWISASLWNNDPASFIAHGSSGDGFAEDQPIYLTTEDDNPNRATLLVLTDGVTSTSYQSFPLVCEFFDGNDESAVAAARARWKAYKDKGHSLVYYQQDDNGRWQNRA